MKYKILWFEDNEEFIASLEKRIKRYIDDLGFEPIIIPKHDDSEVDVLLSSIEEYNLILMDYNLNSGPTAKGEGSKILKEIRNNNLYTEVVFYSSPKNIEIARKEGFDGVFFTEKDQLYDKITKVITLTLKKNQDINNIRGLVIAESIEIEVKIEKLILSYFNFDDERLEVFQTIFDGKSEVVQAKKKCDLINKISKERISSLNGILQHNPLQQEEKEKIKEKIMAIEKFRDLAKDIETDVIEIRNVLAHTIESTEQKNTLISKINKRATIITVNDEWCKETRKKFKLHSKNLDEAGAHLT